MNKVDVRVGFIYDSTQNESFLVYDLNVDVVLCKYVDKEGIPDNNGMFTWSVKAMQLNSRFNPYLTALYMFEQNVFFSFNL